MTTISFVCYMITLVCVLAVAGVGMDFSPSFTAMFLVLFLASTALGEYFRYIGEKKPKYIFIFLGLLLSVVGAIFVFPSVYIYAAGDDWLENCILIALIASAILHITIYFLFYQRQQRKMGIGAGIENWVLLAAGIFTLACAVPSAALWPYGFGVLLILAAKRLEDIKAGRRLSRGVMVLGMLLCDLFLAAPMMF